MISIRIDIPVNTAGPAVNRVLNFLGSDAAKNLVGYESQRTVRENFQMLNETRSNHLGGRRTNYYGSARRGTGYYLQGEYVIVNVHQIGIALHYYGGTVSAGKGVSHVTGGPTRYLTIPADAEAYGHSSSDFDLVLVWGHNGPWALALAERTDTFTERSGYRSVIKAGKIMFILKESVTLEPDPSVLPTPDKLLDNSIKRLSSAISSRWAGGDSPLPEQGNDTA